MSRRIGSIANICQIPKVADSAERNALSPEDGDVVLQLDGYRLYVYDGNLAVWRVFSASAADFTITEEFDVTVDGQVSFSLSTTPLNPSDASSMAVNGLKLTYGHHYSITGDVVTFYPSNAGFTLEAINEFGQPDKVIVQYME